MEINFDNAFLYFFSTIPQVLGALIALLGVFILFKFESIKNTIISFGMQFQDYFNEPFLKKISNKQIDSQIRNLHHGIVRSDQETVSSQIAGIIHHLKDLIDETSLNDDEKSTIWKIRHNNDIQFNCLKLKQSIRTESKKLLFHAGALIAISLILVLTVPILTNKMICIIVPFLIATLVFIWFCFCLYKMIKLITISMSRDY